ILARSLHENGAVVIAARSRLEHGDRAFLRVEGHPLPGEIRVGRRIRWSAAATASNVHRLRLNIGKILISQTATRCAEKRTHGCGSRGEHDLPSQLALPFTE